MSPRELWSLVQALTRGGHGGVRATFRPPAWQPQNYHILPGAPEKDWEREG